MLGRTTYDFVPEGPDCGRGDEHPYLPSCRRNRRFVRLTFEYDTVLAEVRSTWVLLALTRDGTHVPIEFDAVEDTGRAYASAHASAVPAGLKSSIVALSNRSVSGPYADDLAQAVFFQLWVDGEPAPWPRKHFPRFVEFIAKAPRRA